MNFQFTDLQRIISDREYNYSYLNEQLISKADFLNEDFTSFVKEFILDSFALYKIRLSLAENAEQIDEILTDQFIEVKSFIKQCYEFKTIKQIEFLGNNIDSFGNMENVLNKNLLSLKLARLVNENQLGPTSEFVNTSIAMLEEIKLHTNTFHNTEIKNSSSHTGEEDYFLDVTKINKSYKEFNEDLFKYLPFSDYLVCFDLNADAKQLDFFRGKKIQFIYFLSQIQNNLSNPIVNDAIAKRFGISGYRQSKDKHTAQPSLINKVKSILK